MNNQGIGSWISRRARMTPWKTAVIGNGLKWTYSEFERQVNRMAHSLRSLGIHRGDRVAYLNQNHPTYLQTLFAAGMLGATFVPLNIKLPPADLQYILTLTGCRLLLYGSISDKTLDLLKSKTPVKYYISLQNQENLPLQEMLNGQPDSPIDEFVALEETALLSFTSGTTGRPKGVMLSHKNLSWNIFNLLSCTDFLSDDIILVNAPLHRMGALGVAALPCLYKGAALVVHADSDIKKTVELIKRYKISVLFNGPGFFQSLDAFAEKEKTDFSSLRFCIVGGDVVPPELVQRWLDRGIQFQQGYGLTEAAPVALLLDKDELLTKNGSAGRPVFFADVKVVKPDMSDAHPGEKGEILIKGPNITPGYWENPVLTDKKITHNGWLHTEDAARVDSDGHLYILGRTKEAIDTGGDTVYPVEIERITCQQPQIAECAVTDVTENGKAQIVLFAVLKRKASVSEQIILERLRGKLPEHLTPRSVVFVESLPKNANGKIIRGRLKEFLQRGRTTL